MADSVFKYEPPGGPISGPDFIDQTERALGDVAGHSASVESKADAAQALAESASATANEGLLLAGQAMSAAGQAQTAADGAQGAAGVADAKAVAAHARADQAYDLAADAATLGNQGITGAATALAAAQAAQATADTADGKADAAQSAANTADGKAEDAQALAETAMGAYIRTVLAMDLDDTLGAVKLYLVTPEDGAHENLPADAVLPLFVKTESARYPESEQTIVLVQSAWNAGGANLRQRVGIVSYTLDDMAVAWGAWTVPVDGGTLDAAKAYADAEIAAAISGALKYHGDFIGFYETAPSELTASASGEKALKHDGTEIATWDGDAWQTEELEPEIFDLYANTTDDHGYYWFGGHWNLLDFNMDLSVKEDVANKTDSLDLDVGTASGEKYPSELAVATALAGLAPDFSGVQGKIPAGTAGEVLTYSGTAGTVGALAVTSAVGEESPSLVTAGAMAAALAGAGGGVPTVVDYDVPSAVSSGTAMTVPEYTVGNNSLQVLWQGVELRPGSSYQYTETGTAGETSTSITILFALTSGQWMRYRVYG